jgi:hypothetical protein
MLQKRIRVIKRGYLFAVCASFIIATLHGTKYNLLFKDDPTEHDFKLALIKSVTLFIIFVIPSTLLAKWYYKMKKRTLTD